MANKVVTSINIDKDLRDTAKGYGMSISQLVENCLRAELLKIKSFEKQMAEVI